MKYKDDVSEALIKRLPRYHRYLSDLIKMGISRISSKDLGKRMGITSSQVRQDFYSFGEFGLQGYGYDVELLHKEISNVLGVDIVFNMIIVGAGFLGQALANHKMHFETKGFKLVGIFDINSTIIGKKVKEIEIMHMDNLAEFVKATTVDIAVISVPSEFAHDISDRLTNLGIDGLWNLAPVELKSKPEVVIENTQLSDCLMVLGYKLKVSRTKKK